MEVLQTSALPLGDGAGRNSELCGKSPAASMCGYNNGVKKSSASIVLFAATERTCASASAGYHDTRAAGTELATKRQRSEGRSRGAGDPDDLINGAGNGIRTRDFDLGKVALYH